MFIKEFPKSPSDVFTTTPETGNGKKRRSRCLAMSWPLGFGCLSRSRRANQDRSDLSGRSLNAIVEKSKKHELPDVKLVSECLVPDPEWGEWPTQISGIDGNLKKEYSEEQILAPTVVELAAESRKTEPVLERRTIEGISHERSVKPAIEKSTTAPMIDAYIAANAGNEQPAWKARQVWVNSNAIVMNINANSERSAYAVSDVWLAAQSATMGLGWKQRPIENNWNVAEDSIKLDHEKVTNNSALVVEPAAQSTVVEPNEENKVEEDHYTGLKETFDPLISKTMLLGESNKRPLADVDYNVQPGLKRPKIQRD